ncbi:hypothetical protein GJ744_008886 [Endocarpon pusillum]|uniref:Uncharacterized protein n=1 Tax=Endocarpon pusillum TaxID=364733 RepID=A0A8H7AVA7_9EURO|nr:hypothetical protein GJ744_008886 [Endocarpon pusillum]
MATITGVTGNQYIRGTEEYEDRKYQYATSSYETERRMDPQLIIYPKNKNDIALGLKYAHSKNIAVAIRTGDISTVEHPLRMVQTFSWT